MRVSEGRMTSAARGLQALTEVEATLQLLMHDIKFQGADQAGLPKVLSGPDSNPGARESLIRADQCIHPAGARSSRNWSATRRTRVVEYGCAVKPWTLPLTTMDEPSQRHWSRS